MSVERSSEDSAFCAKSRSARWLWSEFVLIFLGTPFLLFALRHTAGPLIPVILISTGFLSSWALKKDPHFHRPRLWNRRGARIACRSIVRHFIPGAILVIAGVLIFIPELFLAFPRRQTALWALVMVAYPCVSVYPQELLFRTWFFHRYDAILPTTAAKVAVSALVFGLAHILFGNWIAPLLSTGGGVIFALTYARGRSTLGCALEHALWGQLIFTVGLGYYFYGGNVGR